MDTFLKSRTKFAHPYTYASSSYKFQTNSLHQLKFEGRRVSERVRKSVSEIYAPQTQLRNRRHQKKRSHAARNGKKRYRAKKLPDNLLYHWLPKIKNKKRLFSHLQGSGDSNKINIDHEKFRGKGRESLTENQQEYNGETLISKYAKYEPDLHQSGQVPMDDQENAVESPSYWNNIDKDQEDSITLERNYNCREKSIEDKKMYCEALTERTDDSLVNGGVGLYPGFSKRLLENRTSDDEVIDQEKIIQLEETYKSLHKTRDEIEAIKEVLGKCQEQPLAFEDAAEYKQNQIRLMDKFSELDIILKNLLTLGDISKSISTSIEVANFEADVKKCTMLTLEPVEKNVVNINLGGNAVGGELKIGERKNHTPPFTLKNTLKLSENVRMIFNNGFELPKVVMCQTEGNLPKVISCDPNKTLNITGVRKCWPFPKVADSMDAKNEVVVCLKDRLKESHPIQEKSINGNDSLEEFRYQLQEEVLAKEQTLEEYKCKCDQLQNEMKLLVWENKKLNEKFDPKQVNKKESGKKMEANLFSCFESQLKGLQKDLESVQAARKEADVERCRLKEAAILLKAQPVTCHSSQNSSDNNNEKMLQLKEQYNRVREDYKTKVTQVAALQVENQNLLLEIEEKAKNLKAAEAEMKELQEKLATTTNDKDRTTGSIGQSCQMTFLEQQLREAKDEIEELNVKQQESMYQEEYYRGKYLLVQQQVEEQRRQIDLMDADNKRITQQVEEEMQRVKCQFQEKLDELKSLPELLRSTQCRLQEAFQKQKQSEERICELKVQLEEASSKRNEAEQKLDRFWSQHDEMINQFDSLKAKVEAWEKKCKELQDLNNKQNNDMKRAEELAAQSKRCSEEKNLEIIQLNNQLENMREESARQIAKNKERYESMRRSYQSQVEELEMRLAQSRAMAHAASAERDETRKRMQCHINNLSENFEQAQSRIRYLQSHVNHLTNSFTSATVDTSIAYSDMTGFCDCE